MKGRIMTLAEREKQIREHAKRLAHRFSSRFGCVTMEDTLCDMGRWCDANQPSPWVSVEERFPKDGQSVVIKFGSDNELLTTAVFFENCSINGKDVKNIFCPIKWDGNTIHFSRFEYFTDITEWMAIPK